MLTLRSFLRKGIDYAKRSIIKFSSFGKFEVPSGKPNLPGIPLQSKLIYPSSILQTKLIHSQNITVKQPFSEKSFNNDQKRHFHFLPITPPVLMPIPPPGPQNGGGLAFLLGLGLLGLTMSFIPTTGVEWIDKTVEKLRGILLLFGRVGVAIIVLALLGVMYGLFFTGLIIHVVFIGYFNNQEEEKEEGRENRFTRQLENFGSAIDETKQFFIKCLPSYKDFS